LDCREQARKIYDYCRVRVREDPDTPTYEEVINHLGYRKGVSGQAIRFGLELVLIACGDRKIPDITAIIVNKSTGKPSGYGHQKLQDKDFQRVFAYKEWPDVDEIDWEFVWENRKELSEEYGTPGYWENNV
jgi:hypothetical protein